MSAVGYMDNCCGCGTAPTCGMCSGKDPIGGTIVGTYSPSGSGYVEHQFPNTTDPGVYLLVYCGGALGFTVYEGLPPFGTGEFTAGQFQACYSSWNILVLGNSGALLDFHAPSWVAGNVMSLAYGRGGRLIDNNFGAAPWVHVGPPPPTLNQDFLGDYAPTSGIAPQANLPPHPFTIIAPGDPANVPPGGKYFGQGNSEDQQGSVAAEARLRTAMPVFLGCSVYGTFDSDGSYPVTLQYDPPYRFTTTLLGIPVGPIPGDPGIPVKTPATGSGPTFAVVKLVPRFKAQGSCGILNSLGIGDGKYILRLTVLNDSDFNWSGSATFTAPGVTLDPGQDNKPWTASPHQKFSIDFALSLANPLSGGKNTFGVLTLQRAIPHDPGGATFVTITLATLNYDLTPTLLGVTCVPQGVSDFSNDRFRLQIQASHNGFPLDNVAVIPSGLSIGNAIYDPFTGINLGDPASFGFASDCFNVFTLLFDILPSTPKPASVTFQITWTDAGHACAIPPNLFTVPLTWT